MRANLWNSHTETLYNIASQVLFSCPLVLGRGDRALEGRLEMEETSKDAVLECTSEPGVELSVTSGDIIGREGTVDVTALSDAEYLSRKHARFRQRVGKWYVENLSTKSFTYVNGKRVEPNTEVEITDGDKVTLGIIRCSFHL